MCTIIEIRLKIFVCVCMLALLSGCGTTQPSTTPTLQPEPTATPAPPPPTETLEPSQAGKVLYRMKFELEHGQVSCARCHALSSNDVNGPSFLNISDRAAERVDGMNAEQYLRESIIDPTAYIVEGKFEYSHPTDYGEALTEKQIIDLIAFMLSQ